MSILPRVGGVCVTAREPHSFRSVNVIDIETMIELGRAGLLKPEQKPEEHFIEQELPRRDGQEWQSPATSAGR